MSSILEATGAGELDPRRLAMQLSHRYRMESQEDRGECAGEGVALRGSVGVYEGESQWPEENLVNLGSSAGRDDRQWGRMHVGAERRAERGTGHTVFAR